MTEIPDDEVEAAAKALDRAHWNGAGCGTNGPSGCLYCYGPSPADSREIAKMILAAVRPGWEKQLAEAVEEARSDGYAQGYSDGQEVAHND